MITVSTPSTPTEPLHELYPGLNKHRLRLEAGNYDEITFAEAWVRLNDPDVQTPVLNYILFPEVDQRYAKHNVVSDRDKAIAATVIQWLGTHVGQAFLRDVTENHKS